MKLHIFESDETSEYYVSHLGYQGEISGDSWKELLSKLMDFVSEDEPDENDPFVKEIFKIDPQASRTFQNMKALVACFQTEAYPDTFAKRLVTSFNTGDRVAILEDENNAHLIQYLMNY